jgi:hypothetical protein
MKSLFTIALIITPLITFGQFGVSYHQSNLPFAGISYEIKDKLRPEIRFGTDNYFEDISIEGVLTYDILNKEEYEFYGGVGVRSNGFTGLVIPIGLNFYPFTGKNFGFQIELTPIIGDEEILRGSWGIRYRFGRD